MPIKWATRRNGQILRKEKYFKTELEIEYMNRSFQVLKLKR